jgi:hypothetical protein
LLNRVDPWSPEQSHIYFVISLFTLFVEVWS